MRKCTDVSLTILRSLPIRNEEMADAAKTELQSSDCASPQSLFPAIDAGVEVKDRVEGLRIDMRNLLRNIGKQLCEAAWLVQSLSVEIINARSEPVVHSLVRRVNESAPLKHIFKQYEDIAQANYVEAMSMQCRFILIEESLKGSSRKYPDSLIEYFTDKKSDFSDNVGKLKSIATVVSSISGLAMRAGSSALGIEASKGEGNDLKCFSSPPQSCSDYADYLVRPENAGEAALRALQDEIDWAYTSCNEGVCAHSLRELEEHKIPCRAAKAIDALKIEEQCQKSGEIRFRNTETRFLNTLKKSILQTPAHHFQADDEAHESDVFHEPHEYEEGNEHDEFVHHAEEPKEPVHHAEEPKELDQQHTAILQATAGAVALARALCQADIHVQGALGAFDTSEKTEAFFHKQLERAQQRKITTKIKDTSLTPSVLHRGVHSSMEQTGSWYSKFVPTHKQAQQTWLHNPFRGDARLVEEIETSNVRALLDFTVSEYISYKSRGFGEQDIGDRLIKVLLKESYAKSFGGILNLNDGGVGYQVVVYNAKKHFVNLIRDKLVSKLVFIANDTYRGNHETLAEAESFLAPIRDAYVAAMVPNVYPTPFTYTKERIQKIGQDAKKNEASTINNSHNFAEFHDRFNASNAATGANPVHAAANAAFDVANKPMPDVVKKVLGGESPVVAVQSAAVEHVKNTVKNTAMSTLDGFKKTIFGSEVDYSTPDHIPPELWDPLKKRCIEVFANSFLRDIQLLVTHTNENDRDLLKSFIFNKHKLQEPPAGGGGSEPEQLDSAMEVARQIKTPGALQLSVAESERWVVKWMAQIIDATRDPKELMTLDTPPLAVKYLTGVLRSEELWSGELSADALSSPLKTGEQLWKSAVNKSGDSPSSEQYLRILLRSYFVFVLKLARCASLALLFTKEQIHQLGLIKSRALSSTINDILDDNSGDYFAPLLRDVEKIAEEHNGSIFKTVTDKARNLYETFQEAPAEHKAALAAGAGLVGAAGVFLVNRNRGSDDEEYENEEEKEHPQRRRQLKGGPTERSRSNSQPPDYYDPYFGYAQPLHPGYAIPPFHPGYAAPPLRPGYAAPPPLHQDYAAPPPLHQGYAASPIHPGFPASGNAPQMQNPYYHFQNAGHTPQGAYGQHPADMSPYVYQGQMSPFIPHPALLAAHQLAAPQQPQERAKLNYRNKDKKRRSKSSRPQGEEDGGEEEEEEEEEEQGGMMQNMKQLVQHAGPLLQHAGPLTELAMSRFMPQGGDYSKLSEAMSGITGGVNINETMSNPGGAISEMMQIHEGEAEARQSPTARAPSSTRASPSKAPRAQLSHRNNAPKRKPKLHLS